MGRAARQLKFSGVFASAITSPRKGTQEIDFCVTLDLIDLLTEAGLQGVALLGAAGEFVHYGLGERQRLLYLANKRTRIPLLAGVSHSTFAGTIEMAAEATAAGADALLVMVPYFYRYQQTEIETFFREFATEVGSTLPILIDHQPSFTSPIALETLMRLLDTGKFDGVVDASGEWDFFEPLIGLRKTRNFALLCGADCLAARAICGGADALLSTAACAIPEVLAALGRSARGCNQSLTQELGAALDLFLEHTHAFPYPTGVKRAMQLKKIPAAGVAVPFHPETCTARDAFDQWFSAWYPAVKETAKRA